MSKTSYEDKVEAIKRIKNGETNINGTARKSGIHPETLRSWIMWYNGHKEFKECSYAEGEIYMTKGRKTTQEELRNAIENYILFYNTKRYQLKLNCMTPMEYHTVVAA